MLQLIFLSVNFYSSLVSTSLAHITIQALQQKRKEDKRILPFVTQFFFSVPNLKQILMSKWHLITNQPLLKEIFEEPPLISYKKGRSLQDILVRVNLS